MVSRNRTSSGRSIANLLGDDGGGSLSLGVILEDLNLDPRDTHFASGDIALKLGAGDARLQAGAFSRCGAAAPPRANCDDCGPDGRE